ncbi:LuxR C-terminal-related transcriptional regulator [Nocardioides sp. GXQ0305]|uniref:helix-turn-helix transcriptional regulator n=1 Tax=Nocardioides sp. GXQ0305 TaxID=3423912 RepID=UPI003D7CDA62
MHPVRTAILDEHEIDVAGVSAVLGRFDDRIRLVDPTQQQPVDVILYGVREQRPGHDAELHLLLRDQPATVIVLGWGPDAPQVDWALSCGAHGRLSKTMTGEQIVNGVETIHRGRDRSAVLPLDGRCHPGLLDVGLTPRELEVLTLITRGLTNQEIADEIFISINSVKTYVRTAYRKIGVLRRAQAVSWGVQHGLAVETAGVRELAAPVV